MENVNYLEQYLDDTDDNLVLADLYESAIINTSIVEESEW